MSHEELTARLDKQDALLQSIHTALVGNPALGNRGLVKRVEEVETKQDAHDRKLVMWGGVTTGAVFVISYLKDRLFN